ncbi:MAG: YjjG family noncanonical pyrimidine nucleotidase [Rikenellaceae bacterium]|nr:YjjG family noncanonical pyrimidine nucleotidase [Rikenellaceae bacterium]
MNKYSNILFDFDRTLWDVDTNQKNAQRFVYDKYGLFSICNDFELFYNIYLEINDRLWLEYRDGKVSREHLRNHRFVETLQRLDNPDPALARTLSNEYINVAPSFNSTIPYSREILEYLDPKYDMHIITNGFNEVQHLKLRNCGLDVFFGEIITSEDAGANKPHPAIFEYAMEKTGAEKHETIVIGDDIENDILGGMNAGIDTVYFNPHKNTDRHGIKPTYEISCLRELRDIL